MKEQVIILGVSKFDFKSDNGQDLKGTQVYYTDLKPKDEDNFKGYMTTKATVSIDEYSKFKDLEFPVLAEANLTIDLTSRRQVKIDSFTVLDKKLEFKV